MTSTTLLPLNLLAKNPAMSLSSMSTLPKIIDITIETQSISTIININPKYVLFDSSGKKCFLNFDILTPKIKLPQSVTALNVKILFEFIRIEFICHKLYGICRTGRALHI